MISTPFKKILLGLANVFAWFWHLLPDIIRIRIITGLFILESRGKPADGLKRLFILQDKLEWVINERAMAYGKGVHPKHRLIRYHDFFVSHIDPGSRVLDIGCGYGAVARSIAQTVPESIVVGVEIDDMRFTQACSGEVPKNLSFVQADARSDLPAGEWDVIVLSNILEHIEDRIGFLQDIIRQAHPKLVLIRVPLFERDWKLPLRRELGVNYFSDPEHFIEHQLHEFCDETGRAGLLVVEKKILWGEIWAVCGCSA